MCACVMDVPVNATGLLDDAATETRVHAPVGPRTEGMTTHACAPMYIAAGKSHHFCLPLLPPPQSTTRTPPSNVTHAQLTDNCSNTRARHKAAKQYNTRNQKYCTLTCRCTQVPICGVNRVLTHVHACTMVCGWAFYSFKNNLY